MTFVRLSTAFFFCTTILSSLRVVVADPDVPPPPPPEGDRKPAKPDSPGIEFSDFVAYDDSMTCNATKAPRMFNNQIRGVNLGGWLVLEPWITPSLFYQFLGGNESTTAMDMYSFCEVLGAKEANRQLRHHWDRWVTKEIIADLAASGAVNSLRLPVGDFMYVPYGPYFGCVDGALEKVMEVLDWALSYGLTVLIDVHTAKGSQNGFDNSGQSLGFKWTSALNRAFSPQLSFEHWPIRNAAWVGEFDPEILSYVTIYHDNIKHSLKVLEKISELYQGHPAVLGLEPINEPWEHTPIEVLKNFYWEGYKIVKEKNPYWKYIMHDSFRLDPNIWGGFMAGCPDRALDTHIYQAWMNPSARTGFYSNACSQKRALAAIEREFGPVIVGEWSLATDNCAMWLNGFNDNLPGFPRMPCKYTPCRTSYLGEDFKGNPVDPSKPLQGPYGTGISGPVFGLCPGTRDWLKENEDDPLTGRDYIKAPPDAPKHLDANGYYFWNFRTDLYDPQWSYMEALERGWIPKGPLQSNPHVQNACIREDNGRYHCVLKPGQLDDTIRGAAAYVLNVEQKLNTTDAQELLKMKGAELHKEVAKLLSDFYENNYMKGASCDFGGIAMLIEQNRTVPEKDLHAFTDDDFYIVHEDSGPPLWLLIVGGLLIAVVAGLIGFIVAMRTNPGFNKRVRSSTLFQPLAKVGSKSSLIRHSLNLPMFEDYEAIAGLEED